VQAQGGNRHRAAVAIVAGIRDVLEVKRGKYAPPDVQCVVAFDNPLAPVCQPAIALLETGSAERKVTLVFAGNAV
jgi:hypothetical protein